MSPWWWVLIGLAAWSFPAIVLALMLGWAILRPPRGRHAQARRRRTSPAAPASRRRETQRSGEEKPPSGI